MPCFGRKTPGLDYRERPCAFGVVERNGRLACVRVERGARSYHDLPGGAIDPGETEEQALVREFVEETGLHVRPVARLGEASQVFLKSDGEPVLNHGGLWTASVRDHDPAAKIEDDHELVWLEPVEALARLRHEAHAWAVALWLRSR